MPLGMSTSLFRTLALDYRRRWRVPLALARMDGTVVLAGNRRGGDNTPELCAVRAQAIAEAARWGDPTAQMAPNQCLVWAVPLMQNQHLVGGLIATLPESRLLARRRSGPAFDTAGAFTHLRRLAEDANLTNAALLAARRREYRVEQMRAEGIESFKNAPLGSIRAMYLLDEPALLAAIRSGNRGQARAILNRLLAAIHHHAGDRLEVVKSFFMELVVSMSRLAVQAGGAPQELLGANYTHISELAHIESEETLAPWLHAMLERLMDGLAQHRERPVHHVVSAAIEFMKTHSHQDISRGDAARAAHLSPAHFSRLFKQQTGQTFSQALCQLRLEKAADLLANGTMGIKEISLETGFMEQSYFTRIFRRHLGMTPRRYRLTHRQPTVSGPDT